MEETAPPVDAAAAAADTVAAEIPFTAENTDQGEGMRLDIEITNLRRQREIGSSYPNLTGNGAAEYDRHAWRREDANGG
jgi:hypothetical protein